VSHSDFAIRVEHLGKRYRIGERERYRALRDTLADAVKSPCGVSRAAAESRRQHDLGAARRLDGSCAR